MAIAADPPPETVGMVDTALIVAFDVSQSVDEARYRLQMEGIAQALEDPGVLASVMSGPNGAILFSMVAWADSARQVIGWQRIASQADAYAVAKLLRNLPHEGGEFTCMARMLRNWAADSGVVMTFARMAIRMMAST